MKLLFIIGFFVTALIGVSCFMFSRLGEEVNAGLLLVLVIASALITGGAYWTLAKQNLIPKGPDRR